MRKSQSSHLKYHLDPAAWVLPGELNAMKILAHCNCGLARMSGEVNVQFIELFSPLTARKGPFIEESKSSDLNYHLDPAA